MLALDELSQCLKVCLIFRFLYVVDFSDFFKAFFEFRNVWYLTQSQKCLA